jgi:hypothetical protein
VDETGDIAVRRGGLDERDNRVARGHVDSRRADIETGVAHHLGRTVRVVLVQVGEHDVLAGADTSSYRLSDRSRASDNYDLVHRVADERAFCSVVSTA